MSNPEETKAEIEMKGDKSHESNAGQGTASEGKTQDNVERRLEPQRGKRPVGGYCGPIATEAFRRAFKDREFDLYWRNDRDRRGWLDSDEERNLASPEISSKATTEEDADEPPSIISELVAGPSSIELIGRPRPITNLLKRARSNPPSQSQSSPIFSVSPSVFVDPGSDREDDGDLLDLSDMEEVDE